MTHNVVVEKSKDYYEKDLRVLFFFFKELLLTMLCGIMNLLDGREGYSRYINYGNSNRPGCEISTKFFEFGINLTQDHKGR